MDRTDTHNADEAWIVKYRNALKDTPVQLSAPMKMRVALNRAYGFFSSSLRRILDRWGRWSPARKTPSSGSAPVLQLPSSIGKRAERSRRERLPVEKAIATTGQLKPAKSTDKSHVRRGA